MQESYLWGNRDEMKINRGGAGSRLSKINMTSRKGIKM